MYRVNAASVLIGNEVERGYDACARLSGVLNSTVEFIGGDLVENNM